MTDNVFEMRRFNKEAKDWGDWFTVTTEAALHQAHLARDDTQVRLKQSVAVVLRLDNIPVPLPSNIKVPVPANVVIDKAVIDRFLRFYLDGSYPSIKTNPREAFTKLLEQTFGSDPLPERR